MDNKPMVALQVTASFPQVLYKVLEFHLFDGATIIDPTPGEKHSWEYYLKECKKPSFFPLTPFEIYFLDDDITSFGMTRDYVSRHGAADAIFYDPPYIFGCSTGPDVRREDYGDYEHSLSQVDSFFHQANEAFPDFLTEDGLVFVKYTDVFSLRDRKFYLCAERWPRTFSNFDVIDHYIIQHHHISPTAWQVKDRPCGIVNYTYLTVFRVREEAFDYEN